MGERTLLSASDRSQFAAWIRSAVERFEGRLLRYAARLTGDAEAGRDVVQDTFLRLCRQQPDELDGHLAEWLFTVCRHRAIDLSRKEQRMHVLTAHQADRAADLHADPQASPAEVAEQHESTDRIGQLVAGLTANQQEVLRLKFQEGLSYREISAITELSVSNVDYLIHTAIAKLREQMGASGE